MMCRSGLGLQMCKFHHTLPHDSGEVLWFHIGGPYVHDPSTINLYLFADNDLSKYQWIFTKRGMYVDIVEICF